MPGDSGTTIRERQGHIDEEGLATGETRQGLTGT